MEEIIFWSRVKYYSNVRSSDMCLPRPHYHESSSSSISASKSAPPSFLPWTPPSSYPSISQPPFSIFVRNSSVQVWCGLFVMQGCASTRAAVRVCDLPVLSAPQLSPRSTCWVIAVLLLCSSSKFQVRTLKTNKATQQSHEMPMCVQTHIGWRKEYRMEGSARPRQIINIFVALSAPCPFN